MRRFLAVLALCGLLVLAGCADADLSPEDVPDGSDLSPGGPGGTDTADGDQGQAPSDPGEGTVEVHSINVGQGDATVIRTESATMLIDSGDWRDDGETVIAYLEALGVERIDHLVSSHAHAEHIGGHAAVIEHYETEADGVGAVYDSQYGHPHDEVLDRLGERDVAVAWTAVHGTTVFVSDGETITVHTQHDATTDPRTIEDEDEATADPADPVEERFVVGDGDSTERLAPISAIGRTTPSAPTGVVPT